jgi:hypothetical protein
VEERDSQLLQPEPPRKGVCGACVSRGWRKHPQIHRAPHSLYVYHAKHSILRPVFSAVSIYFPGIQMQPHVFSINARQLSQSTTIYPNQGRRHAGPGAARTTILANISSLFHTHVQYDHPAPVHLTCICVNHVAEVHIQTPDATLSSDPVTFLYPRFVSTALSCVLSYLTYLPLPLSIS